MDPYSDSMILRSGTSINGIKNSQFFKDLKVLTSVNNTLNTPQYGYCAACFILFATFELLEKYHTEIRENEKLYNYIYKILQVKLQKFLREIDDGGCICKCDDQNYMLEGTILDNIHRMINLSRRDEYKELADYTGYDGDKREKYRMYHKNFFMIEEVETFGEIDYYIKRDFRRTREEVLHWIKYFSQEHKCIINTTTRELKNSLNDDCIGEIVKYMEFIKN